MSSSNTVAQSFDRAHDHYDTYARVQRDSALKLSRMVADTTSTTPESILDLGAGTGNLSRALHNFFPDAHYTLNDRSSFMLTQATQNLPPSMQVTPWIQDMNHILQAPLPFDMIVSNFALQWVPSWREIVRYSLQSAPVIAFSVLLQGTFEAWYEYVRSHSATWSPIPLPTESDVLNCVHDFDDASIYAQTYDDTYHVDTPYHNMIYLKGLGAQRHSSPTLSPSTIRSMMRDSVQRIPMTYRILHLVVVRSEHCL